MEGYENYKWFVITDEAKHQMEKLLSKNPDKYAISLIVEGGGCAGFKYKWGFIDSKDDIGADDHRGLAHRTFRGRRGFDDVRSRNQDRLEGRSLWLTV